jgi:hypothetical protein
MNEIKPKKLGASWFNEEFKYIMDEIITECKVESGIVDDNTNEETRTGVYSDQIKLLALTVYINTVNTLHQYMPLVSVKSMTVTNKEKELNSPEDLFRHVNEEDADIEDRDENNELFQLD